MKKHFHVLQRTEEPSQHIFSTTTKKKLAKFRTGNISKIRKKLRDIDFSKVFRGIATIISNIKMLLFIFDILKDLF